MHIRFWPYRSAFTAIDRVFWAFTNAEIYFYRVVFRSRVQMFGQRDTTTNAQDESSSVVVGRHF